MRPFIVQKFSHKDIRLIIVLFFINIYDDIIFDTISTVANRKTLTMKWQHHLPRKHMIQSEDNF